MIQGRYKKKVVPNATRKAVAIRFGCPPGESIKASCQRCGADGSIVWNRRGNGSPGFWITFPRLELDHVVPEYRGGSGLPENITLLCRKCNRSKGHRN